MGEVSFPDSPFSILICLKSFAKQFKSLLWSVCVWGAEQKTYQTRRLNRFFFADKQKKAHLLLDPKPDSFTETQKCVPNAFTCICIRRLRWSSISLQVWLCHLKLRQLITYIYRLGYGPTLYLNHKIRSIWQSWC